MTLPDHLPLVIGRQGTRMMGSESVALYASHRYAMALRGMQRTLTKRAT